MTAEIAGGDLTLVDKIIKRLDDQDVKRGIYRATPIHFEPLDLAWGDFARERVTISLAPVNPVWDVEGLDRCLISVRNTLAIDTEDVGEFQRASYLRVSSLRKNVLDIPSLTYTEPDAVTVTTAITNKPPRYTVLTAGEDGMQNYNPSSETFMRLIVLSMFPHPELALEAAQKQQGLKGSIILAQGLAAGRIRLKELEDFRKLLTP